MAVKGLDIFKLSPKKNCKECGSPTCMAFCMKVAQGAVPITKCPYMSEEAIALLSEATQPPMKTIEVGAHKLGGETVMMRHEKTLVNRNLFAATLCTCMDDATVEARLEGIKKVDYERIGEREMVECVFVHDAGDSAKFVELCKKAAALPDRTVIIDTKDVETAKAAVEAIKDSKCEYRHLRGCGCAGIVIMLSFFVLLLMGQHFLYPRLNATPIRPLNHRR